MIRDPRMKFGISDKRGRAPTSSDPYIDAEAQSGPVRCSDCGAFFLNKRWYLAQTLPEKFDAESVEEEVQCPSCRKIEEHYSEGVVTLEGEYLWAHEKEIRSMLYNTEKKVMLINPLERILSIDRQGDALVIETTEEKLAEHLGRALFRAHQGDLEVSWSDDHSFCRVHWERAL